MIQGKAGLARSLLGILFAFSLIIVSQPIPSKADQAALKESRTLTCEFNVVHAGQFKGLNYIGSPAEGGIILTLVATAADAKAGRAVLLDGERAAVVALSVQPHQTLFVDNESDDSSVITVFTAAREGADLPAAYSRQLMFGSIPIVSQYTGLCHQK